MNTAAMIASKDFTALESETLKLTTLLEMGHALTGTLQLTSAIEKGLEIMEKQLNVLGGSVTLLQEDTQALTIVASAGFSAKARGVQYRLGGGITGRVV